MRPHGRFLAAALIVLSGGAGRAAAQAEPSEDGLVDLRALWSRATAQRPLAADYVETYLTKPFGAAQPAATEPTLAFEFEGGESLGGDPVPAQAPGGNLVVLPIVPVSAEAAREVYRRQAFLSLYLRKFDAWMALLRVGKLGGLTAPEGDAELFRRQANAAYLELFLIERIALGEGETQEQKCAAYRRAETHAQALALGQGGTEVTEADLPPPWSALLGAAKQHHAAQHRRFPAAICAQAVAVTRTQTRAELEKLLDQKLADTLIAYFDRKLSELAEVQRTFAADFNDAKLAVPRGPIRTLRELVVNAKIEYETVRADKFGLAGKIRTLQGEAAALAELLKAGGGAPKLTLGSQEAELTRQRGEMSKLLAAARAIGAVKLANAADQAALAVCARLPERYEPSATGTDDRPLVNQLDACLKGALAVRTRLVSGATIPPEREAFMKNLSALSKAYLNVNYPKP